MQHLLECCQFKQMWARLVPRQNDENFDGLQSLCIKEIAKALGGPIMSTLANSYASTCKLNLLELSNNADWWKDSEVFDRLLTFLSQQSQLKHIYFFGNSLTSE